MMKGVLVLEDGSRFEGEFFGCCSAAGGEVVFTTGMVGYCESLTDPSYCGQILVFTYPLIGNYGVAKDNIIEGISEQFESLQIQVRAVIVGEYSEEYSHRQAEKSLSAWLEEHNIPGLSGIDTRALTQRLREKGVMRGKIVVEDDKSEEIEKESVAGNFKKGDFSEAGDALLVSQVSVKEKVVYLRGSKKVLLVDCGVKHGILRQFLQRGITLIRVPWDYDFLQEEYDGLFLSNGPGDPTECVKTIEHVRKALMQDKPIFGICLGSQILALAAGAKTYKLRYGHRGQNQPCVQAGTKQCFITSQNHGYAVDEKTLSAGWEVWFTNANDGTNEGICHKTKPFFAVQFHPEACPGPTDAEFLFDRFIEKL